MSASLLRMANEGMSEDEAQALASVVRRQTGHDVEVLRLPLIRLAVIRHARALGRACLEAAREPGHPGQHRGSLP